MDVIKTIVRETLGPLLEKHSFSICTDILLVLLGIKPALLFDYCCSKVEKIAELVLKINNHLKHSGFCDLQFYVVVEVMNDIVVVNKECLQIIRNKLLKELESTEHDISNEFIFIDVTSKLDIPIWSLHEKVFPLLNWLSMCLNSITDSGDCLINEPSTQTIRSMNCHETNPYFCIPCLFGVMLGYPVVYFTDTSENCLNHIPLKLFKVVGKRKGINKKDHIIYSFTVPLTMYEMTKIKMSVSEFLEISLKKNSIFDELILSEETVISSSVSL